MDIKPEPQKLEKLFSGLTTRYNVPHYQRDYSWQREQHEQLWADILDAKSRNQDHFLGCAVLNAEFSTNNDDMFDIVDGQQRFATLTVLIATIRDFSKRKMHEGNSLADKNFATKAYHMAQNLVLHTSEPDHYYLKLNKKDQPVFESIQTENEPLGPDEISIAKSDNRLIKAKKVFSREIIQANADGEYLNELIKFCMTRIQILTIKVRSDTDAYLLFETLNDRGLDLSISDLVKNRVLIACEGNDAMEATVLEKWNVLTELCEKSKFAMHDFLRFYWTAFYKSVSRKDLYKKIKSHISESQKSAPDILSQWIESAEFFSAITDSSDGTLLRFPELPGDCTDHQRALAELHYHGYSVYIPLFLKIKKEREELLEKISPFCLNFLFRLITVGGLSAGRAEAYFFKAIEMLNEQKADRDIIGLFAKEEEASDQNFKDRLVKNRFEKNKTARYILIKKHLHEIGEGHAISSKIQLEHVLPQDLKAWSEFECEGRDREDWIYSIGNMTILEPTVNKSASNRPFPEKAGKFKRRQSSSDQKQTAIPMTYKIHDEYSAGRTWDSKWISERAREIAEQAISIWPLPSERIEL